MDNSKEHIFNKLAAINCGEHLEKKNGFTYLSWPWAVKKLRETDPEARWDVIRFDGLPYLKTEAGCFVEVAVTVQGLTLSQIHPVLDHRNKVIPAPDAFHINTSLQRALVKAIALHGLGLYVYAGEDLPEGEPTTPNTGHQVCADDFDAMTSEQQKFIGGIADQVSNLLETSTPQAAFSWLEDQRLILEEKTALWSLLDSKQRSSLKKAGEELKKAAA